MSHAPSGSTSTRAVLALIVNDIRLHGKGIVLAQICGVGAVALAFYLRRTDPAVGVSLIVNLNLFATLMWADWLMSAEKAKGTFGWLRTLPVSDWELVAAKFLMGGLCCVLFWNVSSLGLAGSYFFRDRIAAWIVIQLGLLAFGALAIAARWRFSQKPGQLLPLAVVFIPLLIFILADRAGGGLTQAMRELWDARYGWVAIASSLVVLHAVIGWLTGAWVARSDTFRFTE